MTLEDVSVDDPDEYAEIFDGELMGVSKNHEFIYLHFPYVVVKVPLEFWASFIEDLKELLKAMGEERIA